MAYQTFFLSVLITSRLDQRNLKVAAYNTKLTLDPTDDAEGAAEDIHDAALGFVFHEATLVQEVLSVSHSLLKVPT